MAREQTDRADPYWARRYAVATHAAESAHTYTWTCPRCRTVNRTRLVIDNYHGRGARRCFRGVEARCGHCHGPILRLTDVKGLTYDPYAKA